MKKLIFLSIISLFSYAHAYEINLKEPFISPLKLNSLLTSGVIDVSRVGLDDVHEINKDSNSTIVYFKPSKKENMMLSQYSLSKKLTHNKEKNISISHIQVRCGDHSTATSSVIFFNMNGQATEFYNTHVGSRVYDPTPCEFKGKYANTPNWLELLSFDTTKVDQLFKLNPKKHPEIYSIIKVKNLTTLRFQPQYSEFSAAMVPSYSDLSYQRQTDTKGTITYSVLSRDFTCDGVINTLVKINFDENGDFIEMIEEDIQSKLNDEDVCRQNKS